jgi:hypothetical protein
MHSASVPSDPVHLMSVLAARQLSRMGIASSGSKLGDQRQTLGVVVESRAVASVVAASLGSASVGILPPHAATETTTKGGMSQRFAMLKRLHPSALDGSDETVNFDIRRCSEARLIRRQIHVIRSAALRASSRSAVTLE